MPTIKDKIYFNFDGEWSHYYGLLHVVLDSSMFEEVFVASRDIVETSKTGSTKPLFHKIDYTPIEFDMTIAFDDSFTENLLDDIIDWLFKDYYRPLYFDGKEDRIYMAIAIGSPTIIHNGLNQGYFTITMRCDSSFLYSPMITTENYVVNNTRNITIFNDGHDIVYPEISLVKNGEGHIEIISMDDDEDIFEIRNLTNQEDIYINCEKEIISTDVIGVSRYDDILGEFPRLLKGGNTFKVTGSCSIQLRYKKKYRY